MRVYFLILEEVGLQWRVTDPNCGFEMHSMHCSFVWRTNFVESYNLDGVCGCVVSQTQDRQTLDTTNYRQTNTRHDKHKT